MSGTLRTSTDPGQTTVRRLQIVAASAVTAVALVGAPAWAAPSFTSGGEAEAGDPDHTVTMQVPDDEAAGPTTEVVLTAPAGFTPLSCLPPVGWSCSVDGRQVTWSRGDALTQLGTFGFQTAVPATPGTYTFPVRQTGTTGTVMWTAGNGAPAMVVTGEAPSDDEPDDADPPPEQDAESQPPSDEQQPDEPAGAASAPPGPDTATSGHDDGGNDSTDEVTSDGSGSTAPTRTEGRSNGTTLEITPDATADDAAPPAVATPDVADEPAPAGPTGPTDTAAAAGVGAADDGGAPWQQLAGAALLAAGTVVVGVRAWRERR